MSVEENKKGVVVDHQHHHHHHQSEPQPQPPPQYGTFQGVANYPPPLPPRPPQQPAIGFPRPVPPPGATASGGPPPDPQYYAHGYQTVPGYAVAEGRPVRERRLPCCGLGFGWFLHVHGCNCNGDKAEMLQWLILGRISFVIWLMMIMRLAILATVAIVFGVVKGVDD